MLEHLVDSARIEYAHKQLASYFNLRHAHMRQVARLDMIALWSGIVERYLPNSRRVYMSMDHIVIFNNLQPLPTSLYRCQGFWKRGSFPDQGHSGQHVAWLECAKWLAQGFRLSLILFNVNKIQSYMKMQSESPNQKILVSLISMAWWRVLSEEFRTWAIQR